MNFPESKNAIVTSTLTYLLVVTLMLVTSPLFAAELPFRLHGGMRATAIVLSPRPVPESVASQKWQSQQNVYSLGVDLGVSNGPWALVALASYGKVDYSCTTRYESLSANDPWGLELLHFDDCQGNKLGIGILGQYIVDVSANWQGVVGTGITWSEQTLQFTTESHGQRPWTRTKTKIESQGFELTILDFEMRWKQASFLTIGPTSSFGWADDRFGTRFTASGGLRVGFE